MPAATDIARDHIFCPAEGCADAQLISTDEHLLGSGVNALSSWVRLPLIISYSSIGFVACAHAGAGPQGAP